MAIRTSAIFYSRGIPKTRNNFGFVAQSNYNVIVPMHKYIRNYNFYNRNIINKNVKGSLFPWNN
jgi:hypothetical protein